MKQITYYYADGSNQPYLNRYDAEKAELKYLEQTNRYLEAVSNYPQIVLEKVELDLRACMNIPEGTIATCSRDSMKVKRMVMVCQKFVETYKEFLNYY